MNSKKLAKIPPFFDKTKNMDLSQNTLLSTLLNDPTSRAMVLHFMTHAEKDTKHKENQVKKLENKLKKTRIMCESPTAQFRKKELARLDSANSPANSESGSSSTYSTNDRDTSECTERVPFNVLLRGLTIYVEVFSNGQDKSLSAKALIKSMGATIIDRIARGVTHVIFKDGSYNTYQLAKRLKLHVVSILWLQAIKRKGTLVPEKDYPAFGADQGDLNVSTICKSLQSEFDDVCQDERSKISTINKTASTIRKNNVAPKKTRSNSIKKTVSDSDDEDSVFLSAKSSKTAVSTVSSTELPDEAILNDSLEFTSNIIENVTANKRTRRKSLYNPENNSMIEINMSRNKRKTMFAIPVLKEPNRDLNLSNNSNKDNVTHVETMNNSTAKDSINLTDRNSSNSTKRRSKSSLESANSSSRSSLNNSMDLTSFALPRRTSTRINSKSEGVFKKPDNLIKDTDSKESSFSEQLSSLRLSSETNKPQSTDSCNRSFDNKIQQSNSLTPSLHMSKDEILNYKGDLMGELSQLRLDTNNSVEKSMEINYVEPQLSVVNANEDISKKRLSDESQNDLTQSKKSRQDNQKKSQQICSDDSVNKKSRKLYDIDNSDNDFILQIDSVNTVELNANVPKGRVKRAMALIAKPFELTPEMNKGKPKSISSDSDNESDNTNKIVAKKRFNTTKKPVSRDTKSKPPAEIFATPKTPKSAPVLNTPSRKSSRFVTPVDYKRFYAGDKLLSMEECNESNDSVITPKLNRRSTMDFTTTMNTPAKSLTQKADSTTKKVSQKSGIACTRFKVGRVNTFAHIVRRLGRFHIEDNVTLRTTHLVVGENKRTVNLLRAIARGCWILSADWLYKSMNSGKWLPEEDFEFTDFSEAVQFCRKEREAFGPSYTADTFVSCGAIYVARRGTKPTGDELRELIRLAGGTVATVARSATIVVGEVVRYDTVQWCVSELWVLDSIMHNRLAELVEYSLINVSEGGTRQERRLSEDY